MVKCNLTNEELSKGGHGLLRDHAEEMAEELLYLRRRVATAPYVDAPIELSKITPEKFPWGWVADIVDPGTDSEEWTGKWYANTSRAEGTTVDLATATAGLARYLADLHNAAFVLRRCAELAIAIADNPEYKSLVNDLMKLARKSLRR